MEWIHSIADLWAWLTGLVGHSEAITSVMFLALTWIVAAIFFFISLLRYKLFGGHPPDEFIYYSVPALFFMVFVFGGTLAISFLTR